VASVVRRRSADRPAVARALGHEEHDALPEAFPRGEDARQGQRDVRVGAFGGRLLTNLDFECYGLLTTVIRIKCSKLELKR
jgi:hypothetical protein